jgi:hypothetical protein
MKFRIRFNKSAGQPGRGTVDHRWRVFDETGKEYICKNVRIQAVAWTAMDANGVDWNFEAEGKMIKEKSTSTIVIV